jgi:hypothetical protein
VMNPGILQNERIFLKMRGYSVVLARVLTQGGQPGGNASDKDFCHLEPGTDFAQLRLQDYLSGVDEDFLHDEIKR